MTKIKAILFDKDGVLVDFEKTWIHVFLNIAAEVGAGDEARIKQLQDLAGYDRKINNFGGGSVWAAGTTDDLVALWSKDETVLSDTQLTSLIDKYCENCIAVPLFVVEDLQKLFSGLKDEGFKLGIATNDLEAGAKKTMQAFGLSRYLEIIIGYDSVENPKPGPDPVYLFCETCGLQPDEVMMIGDNLHDMHMASAAGAGARVGVLTGNSSRQELEGFSDYIIDNVMDLPQIMATVNKST